MLSLRFIFIIVLCIDKKNPIVIKQIDSALFSTLSFIFESKIIKYNHSFMKKNIAFLLLVGTFFGFIAQKTSQLAVKNITNNFTKEFLYLGYPFKNASGFYIHSVDHLAKEKFYYKTELLPLEIRPFKEDLYIAGGMKSNTTFFKLDTLFNISAVDKLEGLTFAPHDFQFLPNNHLLGFAITPETINTVDLVENGVEDAKIEHFTIIELDTLTNEIVHQWNSKNYFSMFEAGDYVKLESKVIDYCHFNSIQYIEQDQSVVLSSRSMSEITKIKWPEGDIIWRLGGQCNDFKFLDDTLGFSAQHQVRLHGDTLVFFDNGTFHENPQSSVVVYKIDEKNKTVKLLRRFYGNDVNFTKRRGGVTLLKSGNYLVSWGSNIHRDYNFTELSPNGETLQNVWHYNPHNYRVNKGTWSPKLLQLVSKKRNKLQFKNNSKHTITVDKITEAKPNANLPITLPPNEVFEVVLIKEEASKMSIDYANKDLFFVSQDFTLK